MISEKIFAKSFTSFWAEHTPWFNDYYSSVNSLVIRKDNPIDIPETGSHVAINNIIATTHFKNITTTPDYKIEESYEESKPLIRLFPFKGDNPYVLTDDYRQIIKIQADRLEAFYTGKLVHNPSFPGCGLMANCQGDLFFRTTLVEIKARAGKQGRKPFEKEDFKQLLVYCALNYMANEKYKIRKIELFNPRMGFLWQSDLEEFVYLISNSTCANLFEKMGNYFSALSDSIDLSTVYLDSYF